MIVGIGTDIIEKDRIEKLIDNNKFIERVLTENEQRIFDSLKKDRKIEFLGGRFSAKEAFSKAYGTGIGKECSFQDIEILADKTGQPLLKTIFAENVHVSISHSRDYITTVVVIEK